MKSLFTFCLIFIISNSIKGQTFSSSELVEAQLKAYNIQNLDAFLDCYSEDVEVYNFPGTLIYKGKIKMREHYTTAWKTNPNQKATINNRIVMGNTVFDHEFITGRSSGIDVKVVAIFKIEDNKIKQVFFVRE